VEYISIVGVDLSGPAGPEKTSVAVFTVARDCLHFTPFECNGSDADILDLVSRLLLAGPVLVGLDAPLSYQPGGGLRERDQSLREELVMRGHPQNRVIPPLAPPRMVYLTLRGYGVSRLLATLPAALVEVVEVHPTASLALRNAPMADVQRVENDQASRTKVQAWFELQGLAGVMLEPACTNHFVAACSAALAAWRSVRGEAVWRAEPEPPLHPYSFVC
jgi:uncharacterized protein